MTDEQIVEVLKAQSEEYQKLVVEHRELKGVLEEINKKHYLTPEEEVEKKRMQKEKLQKKDRMAELIREYKQAHNN